MPPQPIYIELSDDVRRLLASKKIDLQTKLKKQGINSELQGLSLEGRPRVRDPFLVILAAGVTTSLVGGAISRIIAAVAGSQHAQMKERDVHVALDGKGVAIIDNEGNPVYNLAEKPSPLPSQDISATRLIAGKLLTFDTTTGSPAPKPAPASGKKALQEKAPANKPAKSVAKKRRG
jgi:hypothetical protein